MVAVKLDLKDKKILEALDLNARYFISDVAKKVKLNKEVVKYRIHNLEKKGVIRGYTTVINYSKLGLTPIQVKINLMDTKQEDVDKIMEFLKKSPNLKDLRQCDVSWDIVFTVVVNNLAEFQNFSESFNEQFRKFIEFKQVSTTTKFTFFSRSYIPKAEKKRIDLNLCSQVEDFDSVDIDILRIIAYDAKCPLIDVAKKLKLDSMTVKRRIDSMVKRGIIAGFRTHINPKSMGITNYSIRFQLFDTSKLSSFREYIGSLPQTTKIRQCVGGYDFEFGVEVADYFELEDMMNAIKSNYPIIREIVRFTTLRTSTPNIHDNLSSIVRLPAKKEQS